MLDPVLFSLTKLARFCMIIVFTTPRHFVQSHASSFTSPFFFSNFSTYFFHVSFCLPLPLLPLTSNFKAFTIPFSSSFLKTTPYHRMLLALATLSEDSFMPNMYITSSQFLQSKSFTPNIARIIALSVLLEIAISFSLEQHALFPYNIADLTQCGRSKGARSDCDYPDWLRSLWADGWIAWLRYSASFAFWLLLIRCFDSWRHWLEQSRDCDSSFC